MRLSEAREGGRVIARDANAETEHGTILAVRQCARDGRQVLVGWDQHIQTWIEASQLEHVR